MSLWLLRHYTFTWLMLVSMWCASSPVSAGPPINTVDAIAKPNSHVKFEYYEDIESVHNLNSIAKLPNSNWVQAEDGSPTFGFSASQYWLRLQVNNTQATHQNLVFEIGYPLLDYVAVYIIKKNELIHTLTTGDGQPFYPRDIDHPHILARFQLAADEQVDIYARIQTKGSMILPVNIWQEHVFFEGAAKEQKFHFFFYGFLTVIMLINLAIFFTLREKLYLYYALSTLSYILFFVTSRGYGHQLFLSNFPSLNSQLFVSSMPLLALFSLLFAREFLQTKQFNPKLDIAIRCMIYFEYINLVISVLLDYNTAVRVSAVSAVVLFVILFLAGPLSWYAKRRAGVFFTIAWLPLTLGFAATAGRTSGVLSNNFFTEYAMQLGSGIEALILTLALADRLYREREEKIVAQAANIQKEKQRLAIQNELSETLMRDPITNLANRNRFEWLADKTFREHPEEKFIICVTRITRIHEITRTLGISSVDRILKAIASHHNPTVAKLPGVVTSPNSQGEIDAAFQLTADTFGAIVHLQSFEENQTQYQQYIQSLMLPIELDLLSIDLDPQIGSAVYPSDGEDAAQLIRNALVAMESSHYAPDQVVYYDKALDIYNESRLTLMADLKESLRNNGTELYYQPKLDLLHNTIVGLEALIRWNHPQQGFISPATFVPLAEQTGVIKALSLWVIEHALQDLAWLRSKGYQGSMSLNISAKDLLSEKLNGHIKVTLDKHQLEPAALSLELTETAAMDEPEAGLLALNQLTALGVKISIDDFGAGYSSLSYLKQLPASEIKLDRSLIMDVNSSEESRLIVKTSIDMAHGLGYRVVAEGIEDTETYELLKDLQCDQIQGFWLCKPMPLADIQNWLSSWQSSLQ